MSTLIQLQFPYNAKWKKGYLNTNTEGRKTLTLYNSHKDRSSTQYARYLLAIKEGRFLTSDEHADHKDEDKTNDDINNLQILSILENNRKTHCKPKIKCTCPVCKIEFLSDKHGLYKKTPKTKCCSRKCGYKSLTLEFRSTI